MLYSEHIFLNITDYVHCARQIVVEKVLYKHYRWHVSFSHGLMYSVTPVFHYTLLLELRIIVVQEIKRRLCCYLEFFFLLVAIPKMWS